MRHTSRIPTLRVDVPLEGEPLVTILAETFADELRLRAWLRRNPRALRSLGDLAGSALERVDRSDRRAA